MFMPTIDLFWHSEPTMTEHAHRTAAERDACSAEAAARAAWRERALADYYRGRENMDDAQ